MLTVWLYSLLAVTDLMSPAQIGSVDISVTHFIAVLQPGKNIKENEVKRGIPKGDLHHSLFL